MSKVYLYSLCSVFETFRPKTLNQSVQCHNFAPFIIFSLYKLIAQLVGALC